MFAFIIVANLGPTSFSHAMADVARQTLAQRGYQIAFHDLYAEKFDPVQPVGEMANTASADPAIEQHCAEQALADLILVFHPNWWGQPPAILKGWVDRVFRLGTAYAYPSGVGPEGVPVGCCGPATRWCSTPPTPRPSAKPRCLVTRLMRCGSAAFLGCAV